ncbi:hypothetical protein Hdeb2414_s0356g00875161 [Helianthus debilis subsp. tardiflorus]
MGNGDLELGGVDFIQEGVKSLLDYVRTEVSQTNSISPTIYMVPGVIRDLSASSFGPKVVSIGPLHREDDNVQVFEKQKAIFLDTLLGRINYPKHKILESCMKKVQGSMKRIKECYVWKKTYDDAELAKMMIMDACFILEFIYWLKGKSYPGNNLQAASVISDLVLLENQIPFFFLDEIYECTLLKNRPDHSLPQFLHPLLIEVSIFRDNTIKPNIGLNTTHHILSLLHQCYMPQPYLKIEYSSPPQGIHSAIDLDRAGVKFKPYKDPPTWVMGMEVNPYRFPHLFGSWGKPTLRMSVLSIEDSTELVLRDLIAYEQLDEIDKHITSYVWAIDILVNTKEDVATLVDSGVLVNNMGSNEEAANIINSLGNGLGLGYGEFAYGDQWKTLYQYCNAYWPKHIARLRRNYFNGPWNIIALVVGTIIFALTVVQTIFTIKSTENNK